MKPLKLEAMTEPLRTAYRTLRGLLVRTGRDEVLSRRQIGATIVEVKKSPAKYGARAVHQLANALDHDETALYRYATVAECWTEADMELLLKRTTQYGRPLSWSHLVLIATVDSAEARADLVDRSLHESLSVRNLAKLVVAPVPKHSAQIGSGITLATERFVRTTERWSREAGAMHNELVAELEGASLDDPNVNAMLERAIDVQQRLYQTAQLQLQRLTAERSRLQSGRGMARDRHMPRLLAGMPGREPGGAKSRTVDEKLNHGRVAQS